MRDAQIETCEVIEIVHIGLDKMITIIEAVMNPLGIMMVITIEKEDGDTINDMSM